MNGTLQEFPIREPPGRTDSGRDGPRSLTDSNGRALTWCI